MSGAPEGTNREIDALLAQYASGADLGDPARLKSALGGYPAWLPYLAKRLASGPAPLRKAALRMLSDSQTGPGTEAVSAAARDARLPAWLRVLARDLTGAAVEDLGACGPAHRVRIELMVDAGRSEDLMAAFTETPELASEILRAAVEYETVEAGQLLLELQARCGSKEVEKEIRRAVHALRQRGVALLEVRREAPQATPAVQEGVEAYTTPIDGCGARVLLFVRSRTQEAGIDLLQFMLSEESVLLDPARWVAAAEPESASRHWWRSEASRSRSSEGASGPRAAAASPGATRCCDRTCGT